MADPWRPSKPELRDWSPKGSQIYDRLTTSGGSVGYAETVLHIRREEREAMVPFIGNELNKRGCGPETSLGDNAKRAEVTNVCEVLKKSREHGPKLLWARSQGETEEHVEAAIRIIVHSTHTAWKKRFKKNPQRSTILISSPVKEVGQTSTPVPPPSPQPTIKPEPNIRSLPDCVILIHFPDVRERDYPDILSSSDILDNNHEPNYELLRQHITDLTDEQHHHREISRIFCTNFGGVYVRNNASLRVILRGEVKVELQVYLHPSGPERHNGISETPIGNESEELGTRNRGLAIRSLSRQLSQLNTTREVEEDIVQSIETASTDPTTTVARKRLCGEQPFRKINDIGGVSDDDEQPSLKRRRLRRGPKETSTTRETRQRSTSSVSERGVKTVPEAAASGVEEPNTTSSSDDSQPPRRRFPRKLQPRHKTSRISTSPQLPDPPIVPETYSKPANDVAAACDSILTTKTEKTDKTGQEDVNLTKTAPSRIGGDLLSSDSEDDDIESDRESSRVSEATPTPPPETDKDSTLPKFENPPADLPRFNRAEHGYIGGEYDASQSHDDSGLLQKLEDEVESDHEDEGDDDAATRERRESEAKIREVQEHFDEGLLLVTHKLCKHDPKLSSKDDKISLRGMTRDLLMHQAYGATWILWSEDVEMTNIKQEKVNPIGFTYLGDEPGYCKSGTIACVIVLSRWLEVAWEAVNLSRKNGDGKHLPKSSKEEHGYHQPEDAQCPAEEPFGICCPCVERNPAAKLKPVRGINIFVVPTELLVNSVKEWFKQVDMNDPVLQMRLWVQTTQSSTTKPAVHRLGPPGAERRVDFADFLATADEIREVRNNSLSNEKFPLPTGLLRYVCFCTPSSYKDYMVKTGIHALPCGRYIRDEFHMEPRMKNEMMKWARDLVILRRVFSPTAHPKILLASGTPVRMGPQDLFGAMSIACTRFILKKTYEEKDFGNMQAWNDFRVKDAFWQQYTPSGLDKIRSTWSNSRKKEEIKETVRKQWSNLLVAAFLVRGRGSRWKGEVLMPVPRMTYYVQTVRLEEESKNIQARVGRYKQPKQTLKHRPKTLTVNNLATSSAWTMLEKCGTFPYLSKMIDTDVSFELGKEYMDKSKCFTTNFNDNVYTRNLKNLTDSSPKLKAIRSILMSLLLRKDYLGRPAKGLIFAKNNETALILHKWVETIFSKEVGFPVKSSLIYGSMDKNLRQKIADDFQTVDDVTILIGVSKGMGTGITLTRAMFVILAEQQSDPGIWCQQIARMLRKGNYNWSGVVTIELFTEDWSVDRATQRKRLGRVNAAKSAEQEILNELNNLSEKQNISGDTERQPLKDGASDDFIMLG